MSNINRMPASVSTARSRFAALAGADEAGLDLATGALLIAAEEYPQLPLALYLHRLDVLAERVRDRLGDESAPLVVLQELSYTIFEDEGFRGNADAYYDARNSFLNDVLDRRLGIPISLGIVYLEVGSRLGLPLVGISFPGHFLLCYKGEALRVLIDPFEAGRIRFEDEAQTLLDRIYGGMVRLRPAFLRGSGKKAILVRLLSNLKQIYLSTRDEQRALAAVERILLLRPDAPNEVRDRGILLGRTGQSTEAIAELEHYLELAPEAPDASRVCRSIAELARGAGARNARTDGD